MSSIKLVIETLFPKFQVVSIVRQNNYKKTIIVKRSGHKYMLRLFNIEGISKENVQNVIKILDKISKQRNPHILKFYEAIFDQELTYLGIVSEYIEHQYSCPQSETQIWEIVSQVAQALTTYHPKKVHGKIMITNLFVQNDISIIGEMNVLLYLHSMNYQDIYLLAPEFIKSEIYDHKSDIWMLGYLIYQLMYKEPPFAANNLKVLHKKILKGLQLTFNPNYSLNLNNLLRLLLCYDPELRPSIDQVLQFVELAEQGNETVNISRIIPKFKLDKVVLHKKKLDKPDKPIQNIVYLEDVGYKQPYFPPSKVRKQKQKSPDRPLFSIFDLQPQQKTGYSLQLPKVLQQQYSKVKLKSESRRGTPVKVLEETQRMLETNAEPMARHFSLPKRVNAQTSRSKNVVLKINKHASQKLFQYNL